MFKVYTSQKMNKAEKRCICHRQDSLDGSSGFISVNSQLPLSCPEVVKLPPVLSSPPTNKRKRQVNQIELESCKVFNQAMPWAGLGLSTNKSI